MRNTIDEPATRSETSGTQVSRNILLMLWQQKWLVLLGLTVGVCVGLMVFTRAKPVYRSTAQILVVQKRPVIVPQMGGDPTQTFLDDHVYTQLVLLKSPVVIEKTVAGGKLNGLKTFEGQDNIANAIVQGLTVTRDSSGANRTIIHLTFQGPYANETNVILRTLIDSYLSFLGTVFKDVSKETENVMKDVRDLLQDKRAKQEQAYREFREKSPVVWRTKDGLNVHQLRIGEVESKLSSLVLREAELKGRLNAIQEAQKKGKVDPALLNYAEDLKSTNGTKPDSVSPEDSLFHLGLEEKELLQDFGPDHPKVVSVRAKMNAVKELWTRRDALRLEREKALDESKTNTEMTDQVIRGINSELIRIKQTHDVLVKHRDSELQEAKALTKFELKDEEYRAELKRYQELYDQTVKRLQELNLVSDYGGYNSKLIAPPVPGIQIAPNLVQIMMVACILGLLGGAGLGYLSDITDRSFRSPEEIRRRLALPILGHIPYQADVEQQERGQNRLNGVLSSAMCVHHHPSSMDAESYRSLRTALYFGLHAESHKVIQVTSPNMGDGKSTLVGNLGVAIAQSGKRVIILDADCRRPRVHRILGLLPTGVGLTSVLSGEVPLADAIQQTSVAGLDALPCGVRPANPAELLTSPVFAKLISELRDQYDYVLVDTPPLLAVTDPCVVAGRVDGVLLTVRITKNGRPAAERAKEMLTSLGANILGIVVNGIGRDGHGYGYKYYYYDDYRYEYRSSGDEEVEQSTQRNGHAAKH